MRLDIDFEGKKIPAIADDGESSTIVILAHGAGSHMEQATMESLAKVVRTAGVRVVRFNFLYRVLGKGMPDRMPVLMKTYRAVIEAVQMQLKPETLIVGGHSMGGRVASMLASETRVADGLLLFGYPLHPAGQIEKLRDAHLGQIQSPTLCFNGTNDALCTKELMDHVVERLDPATWTMHWIESADHSYSVTKASGRSKAAVFDEMEETLKPWLAERSGNHR